MLKNTQLVSEEISEDMASAKEELDEAVPIHTLLDVSANRSKAELAHKGLLSQVNNFCEIWEVWEVRKVREVRGVREVRE